MKYLVVEIQTDAGGNVNNLVTVHEGQNEAESKYHTVLAYAAVSELPMHAASLMRADGALLERKCYEHEQPIQEEVDA